MNFANPAMPAKNLQPYTWFSMLSHCCVLYQQSPNFTLYTALADVQLLTPSHTQHTQLLPVK